MRPLPSKKKQKAAIEEKRREEIHASLFLAKRQKSMRSTHTMHVKKRKIERNTEESERLLFAVGSLWIGENERESENTGCHFSYFISSKDRERKRRIDSCNSTYAMFIYSPYNSTEITPTLFSTILVYSVYAVSFAIIVSVSVAIFYLTLTVEKLKTLSNLLICNTCVISLFYSFTTFLQVFMVVFGTFIPGGKDSRVFCIVRAYLTVVSTTLLSFSFLLQAVSRLFYSVFHMYHRYLLTWKFHHMLIATQWAVGFIMPITILINHKNVIFRAGAFCTIDLHHSLHLYYIYSTEYLIPALAIILIYIVIIYRVNYYSPPSKQRHSSPAREVKLLGNILIFVAIFTFGGLPSVIYICLMAPQRILSIHFFTMTLIAIPLAIAMEKVSVLWLNVPLRNAFVKCCCCVVAKRNRKSISMVNRCQTSNRTRKTLVNNRIESIEWNQVLPIFCFSLVPSLIFCETMRLKLGTSAVFLSHNYPSGEDNPIISISIYYCSLIIICSGYLIRYAFH